MRCSLNDAPSILRPTVEGTVRIVAKMGPAAMMQPVPQEQPPAVRRPRIAIIDIGLSSAGFIDLIRQQLPENQRHLVVPGSQLDIVPIALNPLDEQQG
jgi:hypothetical protein